jgi:hypothetical protein
LSYTPIFKGPPTAADIAALEPWRASLYHDGIAARMSAEMAYAVATGCGKATDAPDAMQRAHLTESMCRQLGEPSLALEALRTGMSIDGITSVLREALPRRGGTLRIDGAGLAQARRQFALARVAAVAYGSRGARA